MTNPQVSFPNLMKEIENYGILSNFKINYTKSEGMGIALPPSLHHTLQSNFKFKWATSALKYLGTYIPSNLPNIFAMNFLSLLSSICSLLDKWHRGLHSWFGCCNVMSILPKFLYLFQTLPIAIPEVFFFPPN